MKQTFSGSAKLVTLASFLLLVLSLVLSACGDSATATTAPAATKAATTVAATTVAATTAPATTVAATTAPATTVAATTAPATTVAATTAPATTVAATTAASSGTSKTPKKGKIATPAGTPDAKATVPSGGGAAITGSTDPALAVLAKISTASLAAKSATLGVYSAQTDKSGTVTEEFTAGAVINGNDLAMVIQYKGVDANLISAGGKAYVTKANVWQEATADDVKPFSDFLKSLIVIFPNEQELAKFAGSSIASYPKEKLEDGTPVGYLVMDTTGATDATIKSLGTVIYAYDPATSQIALFSNSTDTDYSVILLSDYNNPNNKVVAPTVGATVASGSATATPAATTASSSGSSNDLPNTEPLTFPADVQKAFTANLPQIKDQVVVYYGSTDDAAILAKNVDKSLIAGGYAFAVPNEKTLAEVAPGSGMYFGLYTKAGAPDVLISLMSTTALPDSMKTGFTPEQSKIVLDTLKGKKSFLAVFLGTGLAQTILGGSSSATPGATTAASTGGAPAALPVYPGGTEVAIPAKLKDLVASGGATKNPTMAAYKTTDTLAQIRANLLELFKKEGWTFSGGDSDDKQIETAGIFLIQFTKDKRFVNVTGISNPIGAEVQGFTISGSEKIVSLVSGDR